MSVDADGSIYVADTHYHRVLVFSPEGQLQASFGSLGEEPGSFIYPTDVAGYVWPRRDFSSWVWDDC